ncbi:nuclease-related domain-containing protein [Macrococcus capreoli]|uniref:nuclease-related domain-containing protein n=1 Tax=Macrococcus capreoli TaxID=2982690 RepID=UPI003F41CAB9
MFLKLHATDDYINYLLTAEFRTTLDHNDYRNLQQYKRGLQGEGKFYNLIKDIKGIVCLWDLVLNINGEVQYDFLIISNKRIIHIDIKNYSGIYHYQDGNFQNESGYVHQGLISQLERAHTKLEQFVKHHNLDYQVFSRLLFINPNFRLDHYTGDKRIIFLHQLDTFLDYLRQETYSDIDIQTGHLLCNHHSPISRNRIHYYPYETMIKGVQCKQCGAIGTFVAQTQRIMMCSCGSQISKEAYILQAIDEITLLKTTPFKRKELNEYTKVNISTIKRYLKKYCNIVGNNKSSRYVKNE